MRSELGVSTTDDCCSMLDRGLWLVLLGSSGTTGGRCLTPANTLNPNVKTKKSKLSLICNIYWTTKLRRSFLGMVRHSSVVMSILCTLLFLGKNTFLSSVDFLQTARKVWVDVIITFLSLLTKG